MLLGNGALSESILEFSRHVLHVAHPARALGAATLGLPPPVELAHLLAGVATGRARLLLDVKGNLAAPAARSVRLVVSLSE